MEQLIKDLCNADMRLCDPIIFEIGKLITLDQLIEDYGFGDET